MTIGPHQCGGCAHRINDGRQPTACKAFPDGIPEELLNRNDHTYPYPGDNGILFEQYVRQCNRCAHHEFGFMRCEAFPERIPDDLFFERHDHTKPYPGDNGILFEPREKPKKPIARKVTVMMPKV